MDFFFIPNVSHQGFAKPWKDWSCHQLKFSQLITPSNYLSIHTYIHTFSLIKWWRSRRSTALYQSHTARLQPGYSSSHVVAGQDGRTCVFVSWSGDIIKDQRPGCDASQLRCRKSGWSDFFFCQWSVKCTFSQQSLEDVVGSEVQWSFWLLWSLMYKYMKPKSNLILQFLNIIGTFI